MCEQKKFCTASNGKLGKACDETNNCQYNLALKTLLTCN